jgi:hypothetical protein
VLRARQLECRRDSRAASADDGHLDALATRHGVLLPWVGLREGAEPDALDRSLTTEPSGDNFLLAIRYRKCA